MNSVVRWLLAPSSLPRAPSWWVVFATCGVGYNLLYGLIRQDLVSIAIGMGLVVPTLILRKTGDDSRIVVGFIMFVTMVLAIGFYAGAW